jgi:AbrB family looped-hinge helix DNA binding protein
MAKVTSKFQIKLPKALVKKCRIRAGDELKVLAVGETIHIECQDGIAVQCDRDERIRQFDAASLRQAKRQLKVRGKSEKDKGWTRENLCVRSRAR